MKRNKWMCGIAKALGSISYLPEWQADALMIVGIAIEIAVLVVIFYVAFVVEYTICHFLGKIL